MGYLLALRGRGSLVSERDAGGAIFGNATVPDRIRIFTSFTIRVAQSIDVIALGRHHYCRTHWLVKPLSSSLRLSVVKLVLLHAGTTHQHLG